MFIFWGLTLLTREDPILLLMNIVNRVVLKAASKMEFVYFYMFTSLPVQCLICGTMVLYPVKICHSYWFNKMLIVQ